MQCMEQFHDAMPFSIHMVLLELYYCAVVFSLASVKYWVLVVCGWGQSVPSSQQQQQYSLHSPPPDTAHRAPRSYFPSSPPHLLGERKLYELFW